MKKLLSVSINKNDLKTLIESNLDIILVKEPCERKNHICWNSYPVYESQEFLWEENYDVYVSPNEVKEGSIISCFSKTTCDFGEKYISEYNIIREDKINSNNYDIINIKNNNIQEKLTFGLSQKISNNGNVTPPLPINTVVVPKKFSTNIKITEIVYILLASNVKQSEVLSDLNVEESVMSFLVSDSLGSSTLIPTTHLFSRLDNTPFYVSNMDYSRTYSAATRLNFTEENQIAVKYDASIGKFLIT